MATYLVQDGDATRLDDGLVATIDVDDNLYGRTWIIVEALSASEAIEAGLAYDTDGPKVEGTLVRDHAHAHERLQYLGVEVRS